ncbi:hypothetical protein ACFY7C_32890 [Streptomyces sp. NPDC012769]|uniref:hypothetical protein n=1 Tax=Streptomyces sp. NPDC012769 TaxID=3364848 RepID=UPI0036CB233C
MTALAVRPLLSTAAALVLGGVALAGAPAAYAAPGDNGDVKIHDSQTGEEINANNPKVCRFTLAAFNFDTAQRVNWVISPQPAVNGSAAAGEIILDDGAGATGLVQKIPDGQYKLFWTFDGQQSNAAKHKVFKVDCPENGNGGPGGGNGRPPHGPVGAGGGGVAETIAAEDSSAFGVGSALAAGLAGTAGLILVRRSRRRRTDGAA